MILAILAIVVVGSIARSILGPTGGRSSWSMPTARPLDRRRWDDEPGATWPPTGDVDAGREDRARADRSAQAARARRRPPR